MIQFYTIKGAGRLTSCIGPCLWFFEEIDLKYQLIQIDLTKNENKGRLYLHINPNGKIPALNDDGFILSESSAINFYIAEKYKPEFLGANLSEKTNITQWILWSITQFEPYVASLFINATKPFDERDVQDIQISKFKITEYTNLLNNHLKSNKFIAGDKMSLADIHLASFMHIHSILHTQISAFNNFKRWYQAMMSRESLKKLENKKLLTLSRAI